MRLRRFGNTDLEVSPICFGPMRFAAKDGTDDDASRGGRRALERALERGVNLVHSSYEYGTRWSLSKVLAGHTRRHDIHHVIKVPVPDFPDGGRFDAAKFRLRVEEALTDLHTDRIAVLQHLQRAQPNSDEKRLPDVAAVDEPLRETFETLRAEGKVGYLTSFPYTPGFAEAALATEAFSGLVAYYNAVELEMARFFPALERSGGGFLCISRSWPVCSPTSAPTATPCPLATACAIPHGTAPTGGWRSCANISPPARSPPLQSSSRSPTRSWRA